MNSKPVKMFLTRIPIRQKDKIILLSAGEIVSVMAEGRRLKLQTLNGESYEIDYRLKDLEMRLDSEKFIKLSRSALVNIEFINRAKILNGGNHLIFLENGQQIFTSRTQSKILRKRLFRL